MDITIDQHSLGPVNWTGPGELRISADSQFLDSDGRTRLAGNGTTNYESAVISLVGVEATSAAFTISSTKDSPDNSLATYSARIYDANGVFRGFLFTNWMIPISLGSTVTIEQLSIYNATNAPYRTDTGYTRDETNALFTAIVQANASNLIKGLTKLSTAPASPTNPIAVGDNDPRMTDIAGATSAATPSTIVKRNASGGAKVYDLGGSVYNVKAYGATGDGVTDDTAAINAAITAAEAAGGGKVFFPEGEYHVEGSGNQIFLITKAIIIEGVGFNSRIIVDSAVPNTRDVFRISPDVFVFPTEYWKDNYIFHTVRCLNIYPETGTAARYGILFDTQIADQSLSRALVEEVQIANMASGYAIASLNAAAPENNGTAGLTIRRCQIRGGLYMRPIGDHFHLENNSIGGVEPIDIECYSGAAGMVISGNVIVNDKGFILRAAINPKIINNYFETPAASASIQYFVDLAGSAGSVIDTPIFSGNTVSILSGDVDGVRFNYTNLGQFGEGNWVQQGNVARSGVVISANAVNTVLKAAKYSGPGTPVTNGGVGTRFEKFIHGTTPTIAAGAGAGTGPTIAIAGNDRKGKITLTTGSAPSASAVIATITFLTAYDLAPYAGLYPANAAAAALSGAGKAYAPSTGVTTTSFTINSGTTQLAASTQYIWWYDVDD